MRLWEVCECKSTQNTQDHMKYEKSNAYYDIW